MVSDAAEAPPVLSTGFFMIAVPALVAAILLILAAAYYPGHAARTASVYTNLATPANQALTADMNGYTHSQHTNLAAAKTDLTRLVKADENFNGALDEVTFPKAANEAAAALVLADQKRDNLFEQQQKSSTLRQLRSFDSKDQTANAAVEAQVRQAREDLGLPASSGALF